MRFEVEIDSDEVTERQLLDILEHGFYYDDDVNKITVKELDT